MHAAATESSDRISEAAVDGELLFDFLEEAEDIVRSVDRYVRAWRGDPQNPLYPQNLQESLHILKGGALLCGFYDICRLVHQLEDLLSEFRRPNRRVGELFSPRTRRPARRIVAPVESRREKSRIGPGRERGAGAGCGDSRKSNAAKAQGQRPTARPNVGQVGRAARRRRGLRSGRWVVRRLAMALENVLSDAVCHGIESPRRRFALGKAATGRIDLRISRREDSLVIEVEDDGRGIDAARVRELAGASGLLAGDAELADADCAQFVFAPGLSTSGRIRPACGRGMGLSATRTGIARLGGRIAVDYRPGWGARFVARIPMGIRVERAWIFQWETTAMPFPTPPWKKECRLCPRV